MVTPQQPPSRKGPEGFRRGFAGLVAAAAGAGFLRSAPALLSLGFGWVCARVAGVAAARGRGARHAALGWLPIVGKPAGASLTVGPTRRLGASPPPGWHPRFVLLLRETRKQLELDVLPG